MPRKQKPPNIQNIEVLSARVNSDLYKQISDLAKQRDLTVTQIVRASIREYIARNRTGASNAA
ncbi:MAG TPA: ribbon-helix-helix protein, CopG family [Candidatus Acidoferrum sp.]